MLQVESSDASGISHSVHDLAADFKELADMCAEKGFRVAYENRCWATRVRTWKDVWEIVKKADRPNLGVCLDTFQIAGGEFGDPTTGTGLREDISRADLESRWRASLRELASTVPAEKIFLLQISDAYKVDLPNREPKDGRGQRQRLEWHRNHRTLPFGGGYLPVHDVLRAVLDTRFRGWLSIEVFDSTEKLENTDIESFLKRAITSLQNLLLFS
jgi:sugar phosphate isomerase/epimerase